MGPSQDFQSIKTDICKDVVFEHIATQLLETDLISEEEYQKIKAKETQHEETAEMFEVLSKKGATVCKKFAEVLETDYSWLAERVANNPQLFEPSAPPNISRLASGITQEVIKMVQRNYRVAENWTTVAHSLGLTKLTADIRMKVILNGEKNSMCIFYLLQEWKGRQSREATLENLIQNLRSEEFNDIADELEVKFA